VTGAAVGHCTPACGAPAGSRPGVSLALRLGLQLAPFAPSAWSLRFKVARLLLALSRGPQREGQDSIASVLGSAAVPDGHAATQDWHEGSWGTQRSDSAAEDPTARESLIARRGQRSGVQVPNSESECHSRAGSTAVACALDATKEGGFKLGKAGAGGFERHPLCCGPACGCTSRLEA
jgi:hypothetical protein